MCIDEEFGSQKPWTCDKCGRTYIDESPAYVFIDSIPDPARGYMYCEACVWEENA